MPQATPTAPKPPEVTKVSPSKISEVRSLMAVAESIDEIRRQNPSLYAKLLELVELHNAHLLAAGAAVRTKEVSCGPFELYQWARSDNAQALYDAVGREKFGAMGGELESKEILTVSRARFDALVVAGKIDRELVAKVVSFAPRYHAPKPLALPAK